MSPSPAAPRLRRPAALAVPAVNQVEDEFNIVTVKSHPRRTLRRLHLHSELLLKFSDECLGARLTVIYMSSREVPDVGPAKPVVLSVTQEHLPVESEHTCNNPFQ